MSNHPLCQKRGTIIGLIDKVFSLSHPTFHRENIELVINFLLENAYLLDFIFRVLHDRLKYLFNRTNSNSNNSEHKKEPISYFTTPFVSGISEQFKNIVKDLNVKLSYRNLNKLNFFIKVHKDWLQGLRCLLCWADPRQLHTRISEHKNHIRRNSNNNPVITDHRSSGYQDKF